MIGFWGLERWRCKTEEVLSYCGYRCDLCPAYHKNLRSDDDRERVSRDWLRYYDHAEEPENVECKGCRSGPAEGNPGCRVRPCAMDRDAYTCAECDEFACEKIRRQMDAIKPIAERHRGSMSAADYENYIAPYESEDRLRKMRP
jgi:hypothetical protein